ncbi:MAG: MoxR family ATPase [Lachnospiraceae bacterium]|nr:MoxR family ATPase [Lachnospiraceae bacterium]
MNIREAKQEIKDTVEAYLTKDAAGDYAIPIEKQRPILLIGPPGIGKTAIMEQVASEMGINLVSYTMTHHTRQSLIGLPYIVKHTYGGREYSVTEYTMSEIVASVYDRIERSGVREGILFLDEINCVSETLSPTLLQFLQYKTFGTHRIPDGFVVVTAGNPPEYNKSVRDFDIVTLDRVKRIYVEEDLEPWRNYAVAQGVHGAILAYLSIRREHFYSIHQDLDGKRFVTARGWEDLSRMICVYEQLGKKVTEDLVVQYVQDTDIAASFTSYYELYLRYRDLFRIEDILSGTCTEGGETLAKAPFDEKLSLLGLLTDRLNSNFRTYAEDLATQKSIFSILKKMLPQVRSGSLSASDALTDAIESCTFALENAKKAGIEDRRQMSRDKSVIAALKDLLKETMASDEGNTEGSGTLTQKIPGVHDALAAAGTSSCRTDPAADRIKSWFAAREAARQEKIRECGDALTNSFHFLANTYGEGQELVMFLTQLTEGGVCLPFVNDNGNEAFYHYNKLLLLKDHRAEIKEEIEQTMKLN